MRLDTQNQKTISLLSLIKISLNIQIDIFIYRYVLGTIIFALFPTKCLNYMVIKYYSEQVQNLNHRDIHHLDQTDFTLGTTVKNLGVVTMCSTINPKGRHNNSLNRFSRNVYCPNETFKGKTLRAQKDFSIFRQK